MKIAVIGARGFVGSNIASHLSITHDVTRITRDVLDVLDPVAVGSHLSNYHYDVIVNCAATMTDDHAITDARNNLGLFMNFFDNRGLFGKFINTGSGAEFDRQTNISLALEEDIFHRMPRDSYGWGQNMKSRICWHQSDFYTIRIFNCFGRGEIPTRIFPRFLARTTPLQITNDRYFDYLSIGDLCTIVQHCAENDWETKDVNAVYADKLKISQVLDLFCELNELPKDFYIASESSHNYTGDASKLTSIGIPLQGLDAGLASYLEPR